MSVGIDDGVIFLGARKVIEKLVADADVGLVFRTADCKVRRVRKARIFALFEDLDSRRVQTFGQVESSSPRRLRTMATST